jgi:hypothetical protein
MDALWQGICHTLCLSVAEPICISQLQFICSQIISAANCQGQTMEACGIRLRSVQRVISDMKSSINKGSTVTSHSPWKHHQCNKTVTQLDDFDKM